MADSIQSIKVANIENPLARELIVARQAMIERTLNEGKRPYYKQTSNRWTLVAAIGLYLGYKIYNTKSGTSVEALND